MKRLITICFLFISVTAAVAQNNVWSAGPEVGITLSKYGMDANHNDHVQGLSAGVFFTYSVINTFALTTKFLYAEKGADLGGHDEILKYIEVPITGRFFLTKEGRFRPNFFIGPYFGFLRSVSVRTGNDDPVKIPEFDTIYNTYDLGVTGGVGLNYLVARNTRILLDVRYSHGLTDLVKAPGQVSNDVMSASFGMSFGI